MTAYSQAAIKDASRDRDPTAVAGRRIVAAVADGLIVTVPMLLLASREIEFLEQQDVGVPLGDFCDIHREANEGAACVQALDRVYFTDGEASAAPPLLGLGLALLLLVALQGLTGLTPGKALLGLRTVGEDGRPPGIAKALGRWLLLAVDTAPWLFPLVGLVTVLTTVGHRRVGDMAVKTFVVSRADAGRPIVVPGYTPVHALPTAPSPARGAEQERTPAGLGRGADWRPTTEPLSPPGGRSRAGSSWAEPGATPGATEATPAAGSHAETTTEAAPTAKTPHDGAAAEATPTAGTATGDEAATGATPSAKTVHPGTAQDATPAATRTPHEQAATDATPGADVAPKATSEDTTPSAEAPPEETDTGTKPAPETPDDGATKERTTGDAAAEGASAETTSGDATAEGAPAGRSARDAAAGTGAAADEGAAGKAESTSAGSAADSASAGSAAEPTQEVPAATAGATVGADSTYDPQWDPARGTYIVWEPRRGKWLAWDTSAEEWKAL